MERIVLNQTLGRVSSVRTCAWVVAAAGAALFAGAAAAQSSQPSTSSGKEDPNAQPTRIRRVTPVLRKPLIDLESQAKSRREGQIMPGDPSPGQGAVIDLPETRTPVDSAPKPVAIPREAPVQPVKVTAADPAQRDLTAEKPAAEARPVTTEPAVAPRPITIRRTAENSGAIVTTEPLPELTQAAETDEAPIPTGAELRTGRAAVASDVGADLASDAAVAHREEQVAAPALVVVNAHVNELRAMGSASVNDEPNSELPPVTVLGPARVRVERTSGGESVQWRGGADNWSAVATAAQAEGRVEIRGGVDADATFVVDDRLMVHVDRLARVVIETAGESSGTKSVHLTLARGKVEIRPIAGASGAGWSPWLARVRTPDRTVALVAPSSVEYDAFSGARIRVLDNQTGE